MSILVKNRKRDFLTAALSAAVPVLLLGCLLGLPIYGQSRPHAGAAAGEEFFLISSVDAKKQQLVLKRPTEVTELVRVTDKAAFLDEQGNPLELKDLRSGDTVYVTLVTGVGGSRVAVRIRKGLMTVEELHRRYLKYG